MIDKLRLDAIKKDLSETKKLSEKSLKKINEIKRNNRGSMEPEQMNEIDKTIKVLEKSLKRLKNV